MSIMKPTRWIEEHLGWKIDLRFLSRKVWKAYLLHVCPSLVMLFGGGVAPTTPPVQARPQEVKPHVPSLNKSNHVTLEGRYVLGVATTSASISHSITVAQLQNLKGFRVQPAPPKPTDEPKK
jgi:hypothetical protein